VAANLRELHCEYVPASDDGDHFQVMFELTQDSDEGYLVVQRQFELPDEGVCYVETDDPEFIGHFRVRNARLTKNLFQFEFGNGPARKIKVSFEVTDSGYAEAERILQIMIPDLEIVRDEGLPE
jgi:hypothetical protein